MNDGNVPTIRPSQREFSMKVRDSRRRRFQFDFLERREVLSSGMGSAALAPAMVHTMAKRVVHVTRNLNGSGTAVLAGFSFMADGSIVATGVISGSAKPIGAIGGTMTATIAPGSTSIKSATATFTTPTGALNLTVTTNKGKGSYKIIGGTGVFAGATGKGSITGSVSTATQSASFSFKGTIVTVKH
jgi:hypothetical protein